MKNQIISQTTLQARFYNLGLPMAILLLLCNSLQPVHAQENRYKAQRPYELDWAGRYEDDHVPLIDFEKDEAWTVETDNGTASIHQSQEQLIWDDFTYKLTYKANSKEADFLIQPPEPIEIPDTFTSINIWIHGNYRMWDDRKRDRPVSKLSVLLESNGGETFEILFRRDLGWGGWYLQHMRLTEEQRKAFEGGGKFKGLRLSNCLPDVEETLFFDNISFFEEDYSKPIRYEILPRPGIDLAEGQNLGVHTGEDRLPFPTRDETILPANLTKNFRTTLSKKGESYVFEYKGKDGTLKYHYTPEKGDFTDITAQWSGSTPFTPMANGGIKLKTNDQVDSIITERFGNYRPNTPLARDPKSFELLECRISEETLITKWKVGYDNQSTEVEYTFRLWQKSLVIDVRSLGGEVAEVSLGEIKGAKNPETFGVPYLTGRPKALKMGSHSKPLFMTSLVDYYRTGGSGLYFINKNKDAIYCNGGTYYAPKTNKQRNDCFERLFLTISPNFEEILPEIPNPQAFTRDEAADYLMCYYSVEDREKSYQYWKNTARYGIKNVIAADWELVWREDTESFTFRSSSDPSKGGDANLKEYVDKIQALGFRQALYNNFVDFGPTNALWDEDMVIRLPNGGWQQAWFRTYSAKPTKAVKYSRLISKVVKNKFNPTAGCPDVHTAVNPYARVDFDERIPGAGTMMSQYYSYGQILLEQMRIWNAPTYSEGHKGYYYAGLATGSGGFDGNEYDKDYWLVDFYLRKMQPLGAHISFFGAERRDSDESDRYLARSLAYGMLSLYFGSYHLPFNKYSIRSYYMRQQLQSSYCKALIEDIRYADKDGKFHDVTSAICTNSHRRSQLKLDYDNGLEVWVNGHKEDNWKTPHALLPPNGYYAKLPDGSLEVFSAVKDGERFDYITSPAYDFVDGRGNWTETKLGATKGQLIILKKDDGSLEVIPYETTNFAITIDKNPKTISALDQDYNEIETTTGELRDGMFWIQPVSGAVSYLIRF